MTTLTFLPDGTASCLYTEMIDLKLIGSLHIERVSNIEFNHQKGLWEVTDMQGVVLFESVSRTKCLEWEHQHFNQDET